eukprot:COSAG02_NODE_5986_length_3888_cov_3.618105_4_plen_69_part_00
MKSPQEVKLPLPRFKLPLIQPVAWCVCLPAYLLCVLCAVLWCAVLCSMLCAVLCAVLRAVCCDVLCVL